jgi:hypothetical protein
MRREIFALGGREVAELFVEYGQQGSEAFVEHAFDEIQFAFLPTFFADLRGTWDREHRDP